MRGLRYWDANCFLGWLAADAGRVDRLRPVIKACEAGELRLVTASLTLVEVIKLKSKTPLPQDKEPIIRAFFKHEWLKIRQLDRKTAEFARDLIWRHNVDPKDAVHLATALLVRVDQLDTFDEGLIRFTGKLGQPPLVIGYPNVPEQLELLEQSGDS